MNRLWRRGLLLGIDVLTAVAAVFLAFGIRFAFEGKPIPAQYFSVYLQALPIIIPVRVLIYYFFGLYSQVWSYASVRELFRIVLAVTADTVVATIIIYTLPHTGFPRSIFILGWFLKIAGLGTTRLALRLRREWYAARGTTISATHRVLIVGAGDAGAMLAREYVKHPELGCSVVGFLDDDPHKQGYNVGGRPVLGTREELRAVAERYRVTDLVIAMPSVKGTVVREVVEAGRSLGLHLRTVPGIYELVNGAVSVSQVRDVQIEDILGREEVKVDLEAVAAYVTGETVLVTGAGGSIGSELCRQVARFGPSRLVLLGHGENSIYEIHLELRGKYPELDLCPVIADVQDEMRIRRVFEKYRPGVVFHAAAHKHVPLMEQNPEEAIKNNVFGTLHVARAADFYKAKRFVLISSDKAVNPTSVMGATKRVAECLVQALARSSRTVFVAVRFGNVLGSRGSVVPLFKRQIAAGGPVTVTDPRMVRYFMTIPEAVQLVIQAASMGKGAEIFVLDMGKPVRIYDLAKDVIRLSGFEPEVEIPIVFTGVRDGEKMYEELLTAEEGTKATVHSRIFVAPSVGPGQDATERVMQRLQQLVRGGSIGSKDIIDLVSTIKSESGSLLEGSAG